MSERSEHGRSGKETSGLAIASLVLSCLSIVLGPLGCLPGIVCGHLARLDMRRNPDHGGKGIALAGLIVGYIFFFLIILVLFWTTSTQPGVDIKEIREVKIW
jgi:hypothetical protein